MGVLSFQNYMLLVASWLIEIDDKTSTVKSALNCGIHWLEFLKENIQACTA
jgi:hypothetical protein